MLLPLLSVAVLRYVVSHIVSGGQGSAKAGEGTRLFLLTGFTVLLFGLLFGIGLYEVASHSAWVDPALVTLAVAAGAGVHVALALLVKHYISFGTAEKVSLLLCAAGFLAMALAGGRGKGGMRPVRRCGVDLPRLRQHVGAHGFRQRARLAVLAHFARAVRHGGRHGHRLGRLPCR